MKYVPFVCTQNAGRSQIAQALFGHVITIAHRQTRDCWRAERRDALVLA